MKEIGNDGRFIAYAEGIVLDTRTGLMWAAKDNGSNIDWQGAKSYCENYRGGGYTDWRMPTQDELARLYNSVIIGNNLYHLTKLITLSTSWIWASETKGADAACFSFYYGDRDWGPQSGGSYDGFQARPVRSGK